LQDDVHAVIREVLDATVEKSSLLEGLTLELLQEQGTFPYKLSETERIPFADGLFRTPSGRVEMYSAQAAAKGYDPVPGWVPEAESGRPRRKR
ncbi:MAG TPA: molybdopterin oxidoreductase, partial [Ktedonobacter sp.]|nr:molybdopterin oxidoreductase [Ktedonobacter sp.]